MDWGMWADPNDRQSRAYWVDKSLERSQNDGCVDSMECRQRIWEVACNALYTKPYRCDPENLINYTLLASLGLDELWVNHFMNKGRISQEQVPKHPECTKDNVGLSVFSSLMGLESPFQRSSTCVTFAWTYDPMFRGMDFATGVHSGFWPNCCLCCKEVLTGELLRSPLGPSLPGTYLAL